MDRISWQEMFKEICLVVKKRSACERLKVGCVIVKNNRIVASGYNGFLAGCPHNSIVRNNHEQATVHAEINAICDCANRGVSVENSDIYISHYPCIHCCKAILACGIKTIYYMENYKNDDLVKILCDQKNIKLIKI
jgi:dCMP deaminase